MTSHDLVKWAPSRLYLKRDGIGQTPCSYERYLVVCIVDCVQMNAATDSVMKVLCVVCMSSEGRRGWCLLAECLVLISVTVTRCQWSTDPATPRSTSVLVSLISF